MRLTARYVDYANVDGKDLTGLYLGLSEIALLPVEHNKIKIRL